MQERQRLFGAIVLLKRHVLGQIREGGQVPEAVDFLALDVHLEVVRNSELGQNRLEAAARYLGEVIAFRRGLGR